MKLRIVSDLHVENLRGGLAFYRNFEDLGEDVVIAAGDIDNYKYAAMTLRGLFPNKVIMYVAGNHEFYGADYDEALAVLRKECLANEVVFLQNDIVEFNGQRFLGTTLWAENPPELAKFRIADFNVITRNRRLFGLDDCRNLNAKAQKFLEMRRPDDVVITHFVPNRKYTHPRWRNDALNGFFANNMVTDDVKLWVFGHTHDPIQMDNVVCNPHGYMHERNIFNANLIVEI